MLLALHDVLKRAELFTGHAIKRDALSVRQRMGELLTRLEDGSFHRFETLFEAREGRLGVVVTFLSILELAKERLLDIVQEAALGPIYFKSLATRDGDTAALELSSGFDEDDGAAAANDDACPLCPFPFKGKRSAGRRVGNRCVSKCSYRWVADH